MNTSATALIRGINIFKLLESGPALLLEQIAKTTNYPKTSVLRMLDSLIQLGLIKRDPNTKQYCSVAKIIFNKENSPLFAERLSSALQGLAIETKATAEWYTPDKNGMILSHRHADPGALVQVAARVGFKRIWNSELDSVAQMGYAFCKKLIPPAKAALWLYNDDGDEKYISKTKANNIIKQAKAKQYALDSSFNNNGIRRMACPIIHNDILIGVIALAMPFKPGLDKILTQHKHSIFKYRDALL